METITQPKITGYRQLSPAEAALMNEIKAKGIELQALVQKVQGHLGTQLSASREDADEVARIMAAEPARWVSVARTHFQEGLMALTRGVAQPTTF